MHASSQSPPGLGLVDRMCLDGSNACVLGHAACGQPRPIKGGVQHRLPLLDSLAFTWACFDQKNKTQRLGTIDLQAEKEAKKCQELPSGRKKKIL